MCCHTCLQDSKTDLILQFNQIIKERELEIETKESEIQKLNQIIEVQKNKILDILKSWKDQVFQSNETFKKLTTDIEEKLKKILSHDSKCTQESSTQTGK